jgi:hypothetical protein
VWFGRPVQAEAVAGVEVPPPEPVDLGVPPLDPELDPVELDFPSDVLVDPDVLVDSDVLDGVEARELLAPEPRSPRASLR